jgi:ABC-type microcin C transport system duplicated ATPase subunit YejF
MEDSLRLEEGKFDQSWNSLSGGERQRAVIACALLLAQSIESKIVPTISVVNRYLLLFLFLFRKVNFF